MKKFFIIITLVLLNLSLLACQNSEIEMVQDITYDVVKSTIVFPYQDYELNIGITPLFIRDYTPVNNAEGLYGYMNQQGEIVIDYQYTQAENFTTLGYAEVTYSDGVNVIDSYGNNVLEENMSGWDVVGYSDTYFKLLNRYVEDEPNEILIYNYEGVLLKAYTESTMYNQESEYPINFSTSSILLQDFSINNYPIYNDFDSDNVFTSITFSYRNMISVVKGSSIFTDKRYGVYSLEGDEIVPAEYISEIKFGSLWQFSDIAPIITEEKLLGFIDYTGEIVIEPRYQLSDCEEGYNCYSTAEYYFYNGVQRVTENDNQLIIDYQGNELFKTNENQSILDYNDELIAINNSFEIDDETFNVIDVIDYEGNIILRKELYNEPFIDIVFTRDDSDIFFITSMVDEPDEMYNYEGELLKSDIQVFQKLYNDIYISFVNGVLAVEDLATNKIGFINESGDWEIEPQYDYEAEAFWDNNNYIFYSDGYAIVYKDGYYGVVNKQGEFLIDCVLETSPFSILDFCYEIMVPEISKDKY